MLLINAWSYPAMWVNPLSLSKRIFIFCCFIIKENLYILLFHLMMTLLNLPSCTHVYSFHIETIKIFNKQRFICVFETVKDFSMWNIWCCQSITFCTLSLLLNNCNSSVVKCRRVGKCRMRWPREKIGKHRYIPNHLSIIAWALFIVIAHVILIGNHLAHSLKGVVGSYHIAVHDDDQQIRSSLSRRNNSFSYL
jgi:hypothetical protein